MNGQTFKKQKEVFCKLLLMLVDVADFTLPNSPEENDWFRIKGRRNVISHHASLKLDIVDSLSSIQSQKRKLTPLSFPYL